MRFSAVPFRTSETFARGVKAVAAAGIGVALTASTAFATGCPTKTVATTMTKAEAAQEVRRLQTSLMVAALSCGARVEYNQFVKAYKNDLRTHGQALQSDFDKRYGKGARKQMNAFVTQLANEASSESNANRAGFCANATALFGELNQPTKANLSTVVNRPVEFGVFYQGDQDCTNDQGAGTLVNWEREVPTNAYAQPITVNTPGQR